MNGINDKISLTGMVLAAAPLREADKRLVLLTKEKGKVTVFARGARRPGNPFLAAANPFAFGTFQVQESGSAYRLIQVEIRNYFREISEDMESACYGSYFLEFADYYARENDDGAMLLQLLYAALRALLNPKLDNCLIRYTFELRTMAEGGEYPQVFQCTVCGSDQNLCAIWPKKKQCFVQTLQNQDFRKHSGTGINDLYDAVYDHDTAAAALCFYGICTGQKRTGKRNR